MWTMSQGHITWSCHFFFLGWQKSVFYYVSQCQTGISECGHKSWMGSSKILVKTCLYLGIALVHSFLCGQCTLSRVSYTWLKYISFASGVKPPSDGCQWTLKCTYTRRMCIAYPVNGKDVDSIRNLVYATLQSFMSSCERGFRWGCQWWQKSIYDSKRIAGHTKMLQCPAIVCNEFQQVLIQRWW